MTDFAWPSALEPSSSRLEILSSAGRFSSPTSGFTRTISRPGERMRLTMTFENTNGAMRAALQSHLAGMRGAVHRVLAHDHSNRIRGSFPSTELFSNNTFANGTTGWSVANGTLTANERVMRVTASGAAEVDLYQSVALTQYAPHVLRSIILDGAGTSGLSIGPSINSGGVASNDYQTTRGLRTAVLVAISGSAANQFSAVFSSITGFTSGAFIEVPWCSLSRCALVDNGPNLLLQSDDFTTTWTNTRSTDAANSIASPDGTSTADSIIEDATASNSHEIQQNVTVASTALDYSLSVALKAGTRSFARVVMVESTSSHACYVDVNLSDGTLGTPTVTGANWTNPRAFSVSMGNGWYRFTIVGRKASAGTTLTPVILLATALGTVSYSGDGASLIYAWRATLAQSSVPTRLVATTTTAVSSGTPQALGGGLYTKGWPASTNGLLLPGDQVQIGNQLLIVTAPLNSDAAGLGFLQFAPALRTAAADNAPVIVAQPMGKFFLESDANGWDNKPGLFSGAEIVLSEAA